MILFVLGSSNQAGKQVPFINDGEAPASVVPDATHEGDNNTTPPASPSSQSDSNTTSSPESTPESRRRFRSLRELYETTNFPLSVSDPVYYDDAAQEQIWKDAIRTKHGR